MDEQEQQREVQRLRAQGLTYRRIAKQLGIPLTRAYKLAQQAPVESPEPDAEPEVASFTGSAGDDPPAEDAPEPEPPRPLGAFGYALLRGPYTMPGPRGTVILVDPEP